MTTEDYNLKKRQQRNPGQEQSQGVSGYGFQDVDGQYPMSDYFFGTSINKAAIGEKIEKVWLGGGLQTRDLLGEPPGPSQAGKNFAKSTSSGHHISFDDTRGQERILIKHRTGSGVELRRDGTVIISAKENTVQITGGDQAVTVEGNGKLTYKGNLDLDVTGDLNINCNDFNLNTRGAYTENITEHYRSVVGENMGVTVKGNQSNTVLGVTTSTHLDNYNHIVKGDHSTTVQGDSKFTVSGTFTQSVPTASYRSNGYTVDANTLTLIGGAGNIGGQDVTFGGKGAKFSEGVTAPTFHGSLNGLAKLASEADAITFTHTSTGTETGTASWSDGTNKTDTPTFTVQPKADQTTKLAEGTTGVKTVKIDDGDYFKNFLNKLVDTDGVTAKEISKQEAALLLEDPAIAKSEKFLGYVTSQGLISPQFFKTTPPAINRIINKDTPVYPSKTIGNNIGATRTLSFKPKKGPASITPDPDYNPMTKVNITSDTKLAPGVPISKFTGTKVFPGSWKNVSPDKHKQVARNLYPLAEIINNVRANNEKFEDFNLEVVAGIYNHKGTKPLDADSILKKAEEGRVAIIRLRNGQTGEPSNTKTFELAEHIANNFYFDELKVNYKLYDPNEGLECTLCITMPEIDENWEAKFVGKVITSYNNIRQGEDGELMEILPQSVTSGSNTKPTVVASEGNISYGILPADGVVTASNPDPQAVPKQNIIDAIAKAVRQLGPGYTARITPNGGIAERETTNNHPVGEAADHYLLLNGARINPSQNPSLYKRYITFLVLNAYNKGVRPGIGGYPSFIHYDESTWRQNGPGIAGSWNKGFNVSGIIAGINP